MSGGAGLTVDRYDSVAVLTIDRPERRNAVDLATLTAIREAQIAVVGKGGRALVITGAASAFCAGADLSGVDEEEFASALHDVLYGLTTMPIATMAQTGSVHRLGDLSDALSWAQEIAALAPLTIAGHKLALEVSASEPQVNELVSEARERAWASSDAAEGRKAFWEKRPPKFMGS